MKKIISIALILSLFGCNFNNTPTKTVEEYLNNYISLNDDVVEEVSTAILNEDLSSSNQNIYKEVLLRQYKNMKYEIKDEIINGDESIVSVKITVYDLYGSEAESLKYMNDNIDEFMDFNNLFDNDIYNKYRLDNMLSTTNTVDYNIDFYLDKKDDGWVLQTPDKETMEKINGFYNYEND